MLVYNSHKFIAEKAKYEKRSLHFGDCTECTDFFTDDALWLFCRVPRELCVLGARVELYRKEDMSTRSIRAKRCELETKHDVFAVHLMLSDICVSERGGEFLYAFIFETPYGLLYASSNGDIETERERVIFERVRVHQRKNDGECVQNAARVIG